MAASLMLLLGCEKNTPAEPRDVAADSAAAVGESVPSIPVPSVSDAQPTELDGLQNVVAFHDGFYSGAVPRGEAGFDTLKAMGVRTVISVDGAIPEVELAEARGMRYIHLPIGYSGFDETRKLELTRATRDAMLEGPVYMHCHHGKHRSAGAAGTVVVALGWAEPEAMVARMKVSGTSPHYKGLYACTAEATIVEASLLESIPANFTSISVPTGVVKSMVDIDVAFEHLKWIEKAGWQVPENHPDLVPVSEAGKLADRLRFLIDHERTLAKPPEYRELMVQNWQESSDLKEMLASGESSVESLTAQMKLIASSCKACHVEYRD